jgi:uncharacterized damage-inducible protein DinB
MPLTITQPGTDEYAEFHKGYIAAVEHEADGLAILRRQAKTIEKFRALTDEETARRYAAGKWNVKELIGHLADGERIVSYRLLRIARGDATPLAGFDENTYVAAADSDARDLDDLVDELAAVRAATIALVRSLDDAALARRGEVNNWTLSARGLVFIISGHFQHHVNILRDRYGITV